MPGSRPGFLRRGFSSKQKDGAYDKNEARNIAYRELAEDELENPETSAQHK